MTQSSDTRIVYPGSKSVFVFAIVLIPLGLVAVFCLRAAWAGLTLRDGWPMSIGFAAFAAFMIWMILRVGWAIFGPSMILTPTQIFKPGTFRTRRYPISPDTQVIRWDSRRTRRETHKVGEASRALTSETSLLVMADVNGRMVQIGRSSYASGKIAEQIEDLRRVASITVDHLTPNGLSDRPIPRPAQWPKRGA